MLDLHRIMNGFHGPFATGVTCQQGALTLPDTWSRSPFWDLLVFQLLWLDFSNLPCLYSTFHLEYPLLLSRFRFQIYIWTRRWLAQAWETFWSNMVPITIILCSNSIVAVYNFRMTFAVSWAFITGSDSQAVDTESYQALGLSHRF